MGLDAMILVLLRAAQWWMTRWLCHLWRLPLASSLNAVKLDPWTYTARDFGSVRPQIKTPVTGTHFINTCTSILLEYFGLKGNQTSQYKGSQPEFLWKDSSLKLKLNALTTWHEDPTPLEKTLGKIEAGEKGMTEDEVGLNGIFNSMDMSLESKLQEIVRTEDPGVLQSNGVARSGHDTT